MHVTAVARPIGRARMLLAVTTSTAALLLAAALAPAAWAADAGAAAPSGVETGASGAGGAGGVGGEGSEVEGLVVIAESRPVTATAPTKGSLDETQPESIITGKFIHQVTPETGGWTTVALIAPSVAGISSNGGGVGDYQTLTLRGFKDGNFNLTFDGIAFGDTNDPTHHSADYFPSSTLGAVVVDRGPGAAGDLGQANYGGAIHFFSLTPSEVASAVQKVTYGSFNTLGVVTTLNTGAIARLGGAKLVLNFDERTSDGELSNSGGTQYNQTAKLVIPLGDNATLTLFGQHEENRFNFEDSSGPGETWLQVETFGKNFYMTTDPRSEHFTGFNFERKRTDFEYADYKNQLAPSFLLEDQLYTYWYSNKTWSSNDLAGVVGPDLNGLPAINGVGAVANTSPTFSKVFAATDIGGYAKLNEYRVFGDIIRLNKDWSFGTLKIGGLVEGSRTFRQNCAIDETLGFTVADHRFTPPKFPFTTGCKTLEESSWLQWQAFADFNWRPTPQLTISPGFKWVDFTRNVHASHENVAGGAKNQPLFGSNEYTSPVYFATVNYKVMPYWAVYGQFATGFLIPSLSALYVNGVSLNNVQPQYTTNYQLGTVYTRGPITADADVYWIDATNLQVACTVPDASVPAGVAASFCNTGKARFDGIEAEAAYALPFGLTLFANGSWNESTQLATPANPAIGIPNAIPKEQLAGAPRWTDAFGAVYDHNHWTASLTFKQVGTSVQYNTPPPPIPNPNHIVPTQVTFHLPSYNTLDAEVGYEFEHFAIKVQAFNLADNRTINTFAPGGNSVSLMSAIGQTGTGADGGIYTFQAGRQISVTVVGRFGG